MPSDAACAIAPESVSPSAGCVLIAPDKFKGSADAPRVAGRIAAGPAARTPGAGAAGGVGFAAFAALDALRRPGIDVLLDLAGFDHHAAQARLVVTGEGSLDEQTLRGKAPLGVARRAGLHGVPVVVVCGGLRLPAWRTREAGFAAVYPLTDLQPDRERCLVDVDDLLERTGERIAGWISNAPEAARPRSGTR